MSSEDSSSSLSGSKIGQILKQARKEQGLSLQEVEHATKIRARYLKELEEGNFSVLPAVYVRGSLKTYADHLHLDGEALTQELKHQQASLDEPPAPIYDEPSKSDSARPLISASSPPKEGEGLTTTKGKEDVIPALLSADNRYYAYMGSAAFMILVLAAVAFALARGDDQSTASQEEAREPIASSAAATDDQEGEDAQQSLLQVGDEQSAEDEGDGSSRNEEVGLPDRGAQDLEAARVGRTEQDQSYTAPTQGQAVLPPGGSAEGDGEAGWVGQTGQTQNAPAQQAQASGNATPTSSTPASIEAAPATMEPSIAPVQTIPATAASAASATAEVTVGERKVAAEATASTRFSHTSPTPAPTREFPRSAGR
jgi:cytoskeleton protein RodZ